MLTLSRMKQWSIAYYIETAAAAEVATDAVRANGGLGEYYSEHNTRAPVWVVAGDVRAAADLVGLSEADRVGGPADSAVVARWFDAGVAPNGARGRKFSASDNHGFDLTFCAPKSVSLLRAFGTDVTRKAVVDAHAVAVSEALEYLHAHAGYTRVHNKVTGKKDLLRLPGLVAVAYQHETSRAGDPHLHTHVTMPNKQARGDGKLVSIDSDSLFHEARAAGIIYQATLRRHLHQALGIEWGSVDVVSGMAELAGASAATIAAWSQRATQLREWAANKLVIVDGAPTQGQLATAQKATRPKKPEHLSWAELREHWAADPRDFTINMGEQRAAAAARRETAAQDAAVFNRRRLAAIAADIDKAAFTRADLIEIIGAQLPIEVDGDRRSVREQLEDAADSVGMRISAPRQAHHREGHERYTIDWVLGEELLLLRTVDARDQRAVIPLGVGDVGGLSPDQSQAVRSIAAAPWLVAPLLAPAGAGKTHSLHALRRAARRDRRQVVVLAPNGRAVDGALQQGAGDVGYTVDKALLELRAGRLHWDGRSTVVVIDEAAMVGNGQLREVLAATTAAGVKTVLVGDPFQLGPVRKRGGMFEQLCTDLPWTQRLSEVWRMHDPQEREASLALRNGGPAPLRRAVEWYRRHDRLHCGDEVTMAQDAYRAYLADRDAGNDALLIADTWELCDQLNTRIHAVTVDAQAPTVTGARGHLLAEGDLIVSRRNDTTNDIKVFDYRDGATTPSKTAGPVRNGQRWEVLAVDPDNARIAARRLEDNARVVFHGDYLRQHVHHGYALTLQACQGQTADTCTQLIKTTADRGTLYMGATRGRDTNRIMIYDKIGAEGDHEHGGETTPGVHVARRGTSAEAARLMRTITSRNERARTAHDVAAEVDTHHLPERVASLIAERAQAVPRRRAAYQRWTNTALDRDLQRQQRIQRVWDLHRRRRHSRSINEGHGLDL
ncbi:MobF family relaxase [Mycobacterium sp. 23]|uniref:MobF family relaxase n=1 Tax=Mycobacterium sp. 23 TaxID=3400424 RepID=UPI003AAB7D36